MTAPTVGELKQRYNNGSKMTCVKMPWDIKEWLEDQVISGRFPSISETIRYYLRVAKDASE